MNLAYWLNFSTADVLSISRSPMRPAPFTLGNESCQQFRYEQAHLVTELPRIMRLLDDFEPEVIVNFAALCEVGLSWNHALDYYETNLISLVRLTDELAKRSWFRKFVQIGSSEVYGSVDSPASETAPLRPSSPYATSKAAFDCHLNSIARHQAFPAVIVMPSNGYCEGQTLNRIIPRAIIAAKTGAKLKLQGGGKARKSYLHADDISSAIRLCADKGVLGEVYNCGPENSTSIYEVVEAVAQRFGKTVEDIAEVAPERTGQDAQYLLDSTKIKALGWHGETISLERGIRRMVAWFDKYPELLTMDSTYRHRP